MKILTQKFNFLLRDLACSDTSVGFLKRSETWADTAYIAILFQLQGSRLSQ